MSGQEPRESRSIEEGQSQIQRRKVKLIIVKRFRHSIIINTTLLDALSNITIPHNER